MRKIFAVVLMSMVLGVAQIAIAKTFVDVPSGHWAEDAVQKLVDLGLIEGYPDGTYKGDRQLTRYEYAMVVDRMMKKLDDTYCKKDGECAGGMSEADLLEVKDIVKKLAAEFKDELAALKVKVDENAARIDGLEEDVKASRIGNITVTGSVRQRIDVPSTDVAAGTFYTSYYGGLYDPTGSMAVAGNAIASVESGYEMVPTLIFTGKSGDNVDFSIGLDKSIRTSPIGYDSANEENSELVINHAYADIDFSDTVRELDILKVKSGYQSFAFGPYGMLVDNNGVTSIAAVRLDVGKDVVTLTGIVGAANINGLGVGVQGIGAASGDMYAALRLNLDLPWLEIGVNVLADGLAKEQGWGLDVVLPLLRSTPFLTELRAEYLSVTDNSLGNSPAVGADDASFVLGLDVYKNDTAGLTLSYADLPATVGYSSMDANPFSEYDSLCPEGMDVAPALNCYNSESSSLLFPAGFEGLGLEASYIVFKDVTLAAKGFIGNFAGGTNATVANLDGNDYPGFGALSVSKPINDKSTFRVEYAQQGRDPILLNRVRGELVINF